MNATADLKQTASGRLLELVGRVKKIQGLSEVVASLLAGHGATLDGVWGSSCALVAAALSDAAPGPLVVVCAHPGDVDLFRDDLTLFTGSESEAFAASESFQPAGALSDEVHGDRIRLLKRLAERQPPRIVVASIQSLLQPVPDPKTLSLETRHFRVGDTVDLPQLLTWLVERGFHNTSAVELPGEFSSRGGLLDLFAPDWFDPVRIEFFGDQIESVRRFEVSSQRSLLSLDAIDLTMIKPGPEHQSHLANHLPAGSWFLLVEPADLEQEGTQYLQRIERPQECHGVRAAMAAVTRFPSVTAQSVAAGSLETTCNLRIESVERFSGDIGKVRDELEAAGQGQEVFVVCQTEAEITRLSEIFGRTQLAADGRLHFPLGRLRAGFRLVPDRIALISGAELFHRTDLARPSRRRLGRAIDSFLDLREGDYVVHLAHGIGRYRGLKLLEKEQHKEEHLDIEFDGGTHIFVPASKINLVQKYVGGAKARPSLAKIGGRSWVRQKEAAEQSVTDMAVEMLELQATRAARPGITFPTDTDWQKEFDAAFPYMETSDQLAAIAAIKGDMQSPRPMDRLICGDVGYGKTEVSMRAAFKAIDSGFQVAVLVPTTILAEQHRRTFTSRMAEFPFKIASLSRFCTRRQQQEIIEGLADGSVDIVIGTHRLAQADVQFHNLGLVIIDEEQRFGVDVKERLKTLRQIVDVLTLTATPIPRTLHMSLLGLRDISNLETPPAERLAVETRVTRFDADMIRHSVLRELNRGGQIYFVHNRVNDIEAVATRLRQIVPEARIEIGHGQMAEGELERVMLGFVDHRFDLLLATTIVESGLDIPNANTLFIDQADQYGLADLHQLRGRVGRYVHRAYAYLLLDPNKHLNPAAAKRLRAIEEFSDMGAGFSLAMRDLEIRGAGNILGTQQSGHISAVGYELYCQLLEQAVLGLKRLPQRQPIDVNIDLPGEAYLPRRYVPDMRLKIDIYRRLTRVSAESELDDLVAELQDRFGPPPETAVRLLTLARLRIWAHRWRISSMHLEDGFAVFAYNSRKKIQELAARPPVRLRVVDERSAYLPLKPELAEPDAILEQIKSLLQPE